jgi:2-keto-4-pentenoate hydratase
LLSATSFPSPAVLPSREFTVRCVEAEFGVEIGADVPPRARPYTRESIAEFVAAVIPSLEVVDHRFADWAAVGAPSLVADNAIHGAWIGGQPVPHWRGADLAEHPVMLSANGRLVSTGSGAAVLGHPLNAVAWLASELPRHGRDLRRGDRVTTGTAAPVYFASPGDHVVADFGALGRVELDWSA